MDRRCPLCEPGRDELVLETPLVRVVRDAFPVTPGHVLIAPRRHVARFADLTADERNALFEAVETAWPLVSGSAADRNIGMNDGPSAGQTIGHVNIHLIPRSAGDHPFPAGGVRAVVPHRRDWQRLRAYPADELAHMFVGSGDRTLLHAIERDLADAVSLDAAVAFVTHAGLDLINQHIRRILGASEGRVRIITGDYLGFNEPSLLRRLAKLDGRVACYAMRTTAEVGFHPKMYLIRQREGHRTLLIGSSNLTAAALRGGVEWNCRVDERDHPAIIRDAAEQFEALLAHPSVSAIDEAWVESYESRRPGAILLDPSEAVHEAARRGCTIEPHPIQQDALDALGVDRKRGSRAGLVVLATGLGKTFLAAFFRERERFGKTLFVAHREEILAQAERTFRQVSAGASTSWIDADGLDSSGDCVFASVQKLAQPAVLRELPPDAFDLVIVDEFHHAAAAQYQRTINHFRPSYLLGLTATPDRADSQDVVALCGGNLVYRCDLFDAVDAGRLCPFDYFGIADPIDYTQIPWRGRSFDPSLLEAELQSNARVQKAIEEWRTRLGRSRRTLVFCSTVAHLQVMRRAFQSAVPDLRCAEVHSGPGADDRAGSLRALQTGEVELLFSVDMLSEGVDVPEVDGILMLRPTDSPVLFLQQLGRGLRARPGKRLQVVDFVGNHRSFFARLQALRGSAQLGSCIEFLREIQASEGVGVLPAGCSVTYDLHAIQLLEQSAPTNRRAATLLDWCAFWRADHGRSPTFLEALCGYFAPGGKPDPTRLSESWAAARERSDAATGEESKEGRERDAALDDSVRAMGRVSAIELLAFECWLDSGRPSGIPLMAFERWMHARSDRDGRIDLWLGRSAEDVASELPRVLGTEIKGTRFGDFELEIGSQGIACRSRWDADESLIDEVSEVTRGWIELHAMTTQRTWAAALKRQARACVRSDGSRVKAYWALVAEGGVLRLQVFPRAGGANPQNEEYAESLGLLLRRLASISATLVASYVDTSRVRDLPMHRRLIALVRGTYPLTLSASIDVDDLRRMLQKGQTRVGQSEGVRGGNDTRGMFMHIRVTGWSCEQLAGYLETGVNPSTQRDRHHAPV